MLFTYGKEIKRQIEEFKPDVIIGNDILTPLLAYRAGKRKGIPTIFYAIDIEHKLVPSRFLQPLAKLIESKNIKDADLVISINEGLRDYTIKMGAKPEKTMVIRAGIDSGKFNPSIDGGEIRQKFGIKKDDTVLFFMGWLYHFSGLKEVALDMAKLDDKSIKFLLVGEGDAYDDLCAIRDKYGMRDQIILVGKQPYDVLPKYLAAADICLLPAYNNEIMRDIVPIKMYEYMASGKPVLSTKLPGGMKEVGNGNGVVYIDRPESTVNRAIQMLKDGSYSSESKRAVDFVVKNSWDKITEQYEQVLSAIMDNRATSGA
jgi:glycosyltransferase involved in cell wall biosynthesis